MTHSPNINRKKRANECDGFDPHSWKRPKTGNFDDNEIVDVKDVNRIPFSNNLEFFNASQNKEQLIPHSSLTLTNGFHNNFSDCNGQSEASSLSQEYSQFHQSNFKYLPDLNAIENPHYYENNRLLFELYVERLRRSASHSANTSHQF